MLQLLFHLWGDYILQNNWMGNKKTLFTKKGWFACLIQVKNWCFTDTGFSEATPLFISVWLLFIIDNILHVTINYLALFYL